MADDPVQPAVRKIGQVGRPPPRALIWNRTDEAHSICSLVDRTILNRQNGRHPAFEFLDDGARSNELAVGAHWLAIPDAVFLIGWGKGPGVSSDAYGRPGAVELVCVAVVLALCADRAVSANGGGPFKIAT